MTRWPWRRWTSVTGGWSLPVLLLVAVVVPSACVLWFMNEAVEHQAVAARQAVGDAHRAQLRLVRDRLASVWQTRLDALKVDPSPNAPEYFSRLVASGAADSIVVLGENRTPVYPAAVPVDARPIDPAASDAALMAQRLVRDHVRTGNSQAAIESIRRLFATGPASRGTDGQGRLIAASQRLLLINLLPLGERRDTESRRLIELVNDYSVPLPSAQRLFLMEQLRTLVPTASFPTYEAERLALAFLERDRPLPAISGLRPTAIPDVWQIAWEANRFLALYKTATVVHVLETEVKTHASADVYFQMTVSDRRIGDDDNAIEISPTLPGWEVTFVANDRAIEAGQARSRRNAYVSIAAIAIVLIAAAAFTIGSVARRQARLAALKTDLVSAVSHELKTPLASMRLLVDALLEDDTLEPAKTRDYLKLMAVENARLTRLIDNFLTFSRLERHRQRFDFASVNPADIVHDALLAVPEDRRADHAPHVDVAPDLPSIVADHDAMVTVLLNLLDNAYKYTSADKRIDIRVFRESADGGRVVFAVDDNGIGIPVREQKRIFRRFYRVDQRLARETTGSGLGLSIVDAIVRAHGGSVKVESRQTQGSTFMVYVPCAPEGVAV